MEWESPWGTGYPGWHIECSAMSVKYLGQPFDIHTGGIDHISPHHTNEIAQSEAAAGKPLAHVWLHGDFMLVDGQKMSKSIGNVVTVDDLIRRGHNPLAFRMLALMTHYRKPLNFTWESLQSAEQALANLYQLVRRLPKPAGDVVVGETFEQQFRSALADDLNLPQALAVLWEVVKSDLPAPDKAAAVLQWDTVFGLDLALVIGETIEIPIEAVEGGAIGNLPEDSLIVIRGALGLSLSVTNPEPTSGGRERSSVQASDADRARAARTARLAKSAREMLRARETHADQLKELMGANDYEQMMSRDRRKIPAIERGLLRRALFVAEPARKSRVPRRRNRSDR